MKVKQSRLKPMKIKPFSKHEIDRRLKALKRIFAEIDADPSLKAGIKKFVKLTTQ